MSSPSFPDLDRLVSQLNITGLQNKDAPLYQVIYQLIIFSQRVRRELETQISGPSGPVSNIANQQFLTWVGNLPTLPNSRNLLAGENITFDDTVFGERTINASAAISDHVVMSDGAQPPSPMDDGNGNFIYITYTP